MDRIDPIHDQDTMDERLADALASGTWRCTMPRPPVDDKPDETDDVPALVESHEEEDLRAKWKDFQYLRETYEDGDIMIRRHTHGEEFLKDPYRFEKE